MNLRDKLNNKQSIYGTWCIIPSPEVVNIIAQAGLDFVIIDMEHGPCDYVMAQRMIMAVEANSCEAIIRVPQNSESDILRALDIGASGIIVPHIDNESECANVVSYIKYSPVGIRGYNPYTRSSGYSYRSGHTQEVNKKILTSIIIESKAAIDNLDKILDNHELDIVYIGVYDISIDLGIPGQVKDKKVLDVLESAVKRIIARGKIAGAMYHNLEDLNYLQMVGVQFLVYKVDANVFFEAYSSFK